MSIYVDRNILQDINNITFQSYVAHYLTKPRWRNNLCFCNRNVMSQRLVLPFLDIVTWHNDVYRDELYIISRDFWHGSGPQIPANNWGMGEWRGLRNAQILVSQHRSKLLVVNWWRELVELWDVGDVQVLTTALRHLVSGLWEICQTCFRPFGHSKLTLLRFEPKDLDSCSTGHVPGHHRNPSENDRLRHVWISDASQLYTQMWSCTDFRLSLGCLYRQHLNLYRPSLGSVMARRCRVSLAFLGAWYGSPVSPDHRRNNRNNRNEKLLSQDAKLTGVEPHCGSSLWGGDVAARES